MEDVQVKANQAFTVGVELDEEKQPQQEMLEDFKFINQVLEEMVGAMPVLAVSETGLYTVVPTCGCPGCKGFREWYVPAASKSPVRAMRRYVEKSAEFNNLTDGADHATKH